jgi:hypothetical protein
MRKVKTPVIYQDCQAVVSLVTKGGGITRPKHLRAHMHLGKEMIDEGRGSVEYKRVEEMVEDGFSKFYDLVAHKAFAMII